MQLNANSTSASNKHSVHFSYSESLTEVWEFTSFPSVSSSFGNSTSKSDARKPQPMSCDVTIKMQKSIAMEKTAGILNLKTWPEWCIVLQGYLINTISHHLII